MADDRIFVQIPAYRDPQLVPTLDSLFGAAYDAERLRVRVCWQHARADRLPDRYNNHPGLEVDHVDYRHSQGANWARRRVQRSWSGEPYSLIIDSHLRFVRHWDQKLIQLMRALKSAGTERPVITCYPPDFDPNASAIASRSRTPSKIYREAYIDGLLIHFAAFELPLWKWLSAPVPAQFLALGFLFSEGRFNQEIPLDPNIYFFGDEITTGLRAYCHGYDFFHPHRVLAWHAYDRKTRRCHWEDHQNWLRVDRKSRNRVRRVLLRRGHRDYPLGATRTVASYERFIGMPLVERNQAK
ncbi:MAG TPA: GlcNAc-transferase family protein [Polyangiaceae bacterium]|nr:GlcNAc-transferase family protein [Polyangiaceae bacterium]